MAMGRRRYVLRGVPDGWRIWDNKRARFWGDFYEMSPDELVAGLNRDGLSEAANDGELWNFWYTAIPEPEGMRAYVETTLQEHAEGGTLPRVVRGVATNKRFTPAVA
jgi:hypothetical protein